MDTTSNSISRILHLLAKNPSVQEKLRAELVEAQGGPGADADISYDDLIKLPYLDAVCRETLRLHTPISYAPRVYVLHLSLPVIAALNLTTALVCRRVRCGGTGL